MPVASLDHPVSLDEMDSMSDVEYTRLTQECYSGSHAEGSCPLCRDEAFQNEDLGYDADQDREARTSYLDTIWSKKGFDWKPGKATLERRSEQLVVAHKMVKSFTDTFATAKGGRYMVTFDPTVDTAGTDYDSKKIVISPAPVLDDTIDAQTAGKVLTAMAVHESSHVRYGRRWRQAVNKRWPGNDQTALTASALSNILSDLVINRAFVADYPGYEHVYAPAFKYVADAVARKQGSPDGLIHMGPEPTPVQLAGSAINYDTYTAWPESLAAERQWWKDWADRHGMADSSRLHVAALEEAIDHIKATEEPEPQAQSGGQGKGSGQGQSGGEPADQDAGTEPDDSESDQAGDASQAVKDLANDLTNEAYGAEMSEAVAAAAIANGVDASTIDGVKAAEIVAAAAQQHPVELLDWPGVDQTIDVRHTRQLKGKAGRKAQVNPQASAAIRNAFLRSRTGRSNMEKLQPRGRLDNRSLSRLAHSDYRLFHRRNAVSPGKYLIWLLVDWSGSMVGEPERQVEDVAAAIADASRFVPSMRMAVMGWTSGQSNIAHSYAGLYETWRSGQPVSEIGNLHRIDEGGTPDAFVIAHARKAILKDAARDEQPVIIVLTDGNGMSYSRAEVEAARADGVRVIGIGAGHVSVANFKATYGDDNYIVVRSMQEAAMPLARLLGRMVAS